MIPLLHALVAGLASLALSCAAAAQDIDVDL